MRITNTLYLQTITVNYDDHVKYIIYVTEYNPYFMQYSILHGYHLL